LTELQAFQLRALPSSGIISDAMLTSGAEALNNYPSTGKGTSSTRAEKAN
jgi:hypothetical protein